MTKRQAKQLPTNMTTKVLLKNTKTELRVCEKLKETVIKNFKDWQVIL